MYKAVEVVAVHFKHRSQWKMVYQIHIVLINICFKCFLMKEKLEFHPVVNKQFSYLAHHVFVSSEIFLHWHTSRRGNKIAVYRSHFELESTQFYYHKLITSLLKMILDILDMLQVNIIFRLKFVNPVRFSISTVS